MPLETQSWFTISQVCNLLNVTEKTVKNRCYKGKFNYKIEHINGRKKIFIHSSSLPQRAKRELMTKTHESPSPLQKSF